MNISSIVVQVLPQDYDKVKEALIASGVCDYHFGDKAKGKMVVTIEGENVDEEVEKIMAIQKIQGVLTADMMQTYQEELDSAIRKLEADSAVPAILNDDTVDPKDIVYAGDLKKRF